MQFIYINYFDGLKKQGNEDPRFLSRIRSLFMCLIFATLGHTLQTYESGVFKDGDNFNYGNSGGKHKIYKVGIGSLTGQ